MEIILFMEIKIKIFVFVIIYNFGKNYINLLNYFCDFVVWNKFVKEKKMG